MLFLTGTITLIADLNSGAVIGRDQCDKIEILKCRFILQFTEQSGN